MMFLLKTGPEWTYGPPPPMDPMWYLRVMSHFALAYVGSIQCFVVSPRFSIAGKPDGTAKLVRNW